MRGCRTPPGRNDYVTPAGAGGKGGKGGKAPIRLSKMSRRNVYR